MSASTVSITANPGAATRRRPVVTADKKQSGVDLVNDPTVSPNVAAGNDKVTIGGGNNKDLSHSIRGEAIIERSREMVQNKKPQLPNSNPPLRRTRKTVNSRPEKPKWVTILSVVTKNLLLVFVLLGLVQMVRKLVVSSRNDGSGSLLGFSDVEGRIADVESSLKTTSKMMQIQLEVVDKKIGAEVGNLRTEVDRKIAQQGVKFDSELRRLEERSESLEKGLDELKSKDLLGKSDFMRLYDELKKENGGGVDEMGVSLDDIRVMAREVVLKEIEKHAADGLGRVDYALASGGAMVVKHSEPLVLGKGSNWFSMKNRQGVHVDAEKILKPSFGEPGQCFPLKGSSGFVQIRLRTAIIPEAITLEHVAKSVAYDRSSAPKDCRVSGWLQGGQGPQGLDIDPAVDREEMLLLAEFSYDLDKSNAQTFNVLEQASSVVIDTVRFEFSSNHGSPSHTCIYRIRVHGHEPSSVSVMAAAADP